MEIFLSNLNCIANLGHIGISRVNWGVSGSYVQKLHWLTCSEPTMVYMFRNCIGPHNYSETTLVHMVRNFIGSHVQKLL